MFSIIYVCRKSVISPEIQKCPWNIFYELNFVLVLDLDRSHLEFEIWNPSQFPASMKLNQTLSMNLKVYNFSFPLISLIFQFMQVWFHYIRQGIRSFLQSSPDVSPKFWRLVGSFKSRLLCAKLKPRSIAFQRCIS